MSVYTTREITREEAINEIRQELARRKDISQLSDYELEQMMFDMFGREGLEYSRLENYIIN